MMGGLMDVLHQMIDMNRVAMSRTWWLAEQLGVPTPESAGAAEEQADRLHHLLFKWEEQVTGVAYVVPPPRGTPGGSVPPAEIARDGH